MQGSVTKAEANSTENATFVVITVAGEGSAWLKPGSFYRLSVPCHAAPAPEPLLRLRNTTSMLPLLLLLSLFVVLASMGIYRRGARPFLLRDRDTKIPCSSTTQIQRQARLCVLCIQACVMWCSVSVHGTKAAS